jgi:hypothetical protein
MSERLTVAAIRQALDGLPDTAGVLIEDDLGWQSVLARVFSVGRSTDDPGLVLKTEPYRPKGPTA